jgi:hypothetical protein
MIKIISPITQVDTTAQFTLGTRTKTKDGNEYIYLPGTSSVAKYDAVMFITAANMSYGSVTRLATTGGIGLVGIAQGAIINSKYGWFQTGGVGWANAGRRATAGLAMYASGTVGTVGTGVVNGDLLAGMFCIGTGEASGTCKALLNDPFCTDTLN